ncbi:GNAT family N-acetyltransferase [Pseudomonas sp. C2B4]|uniref:GNAT family N-acetyltransferase n=1 Tax=Pseudomonas sp. C2B4 TaxID=2735270 RepID=UPI001C49C6A4|nr:GNAT family N-acetyltransferase [Pseudomonas sp. C2B4]
MATELTVRVAQQDDREWIIAANGNVYATEFGFDRRFQDGIAEKMRTFLELPSSFKRIWVGLVGDKRVASIAISDRADSVAFLNFVLVLPQYRGKGAGSAMMKLALDHARQHSFKQVQLETYSCLVDARALYGRLNFQMTEVMLGQKAYGKKFDLEFWSLKL